MLAGATAVIAAGTDAGVGALPLIGPPPPANPAENVLAEGHASTIVVRAHAIDSAIG